MNARIVVTILLVSFAVGCGESGPNDALPYAMVGGGSSQVGYGGGGYGDGYGGSSDPYASTPSTAADSDCDESTPTYGEVTVFAKCVGCHSSAKTGADRKSAPVDVNFNSKEAADEVAERAAGMVRAGAMPPRSTGVVLTVWEKEQLYAWAECAM